MGNSTISMVIFNSYVKLPEGYIYIFGNVGNGWILQKHHGSRWIAFFSGKSEHRKPMGFYIPSNQKAFPEFSHHPILSMDPDYNAQITWLWVIRIIPSTKIWWFSPSNGGGNRGGVGEVGAS
jgi:hypothetical protein